MLLANPADDPPVESLRSVGEHASYIPGSVHLPQKHPSHRFILRILSLELQLKISPCLTPGFREEVLEAVEYIVRLLADASWERDHTANPTLLP